MKRAEKLYDAITEVKDELVEEAAEVRPAKKKVHWLRWGSLAAVLVLVSGWVTGVIPFFPIGGSSGNTGHDSGTTFMSYAGPVFPLTTVSGGEGLTAARDLTCDFARWEPVWKSVEDMADESVANGGVWTREEYLKLYRKNWPKGGYYTRSLDLEVTDSYTLTNPTGEDRTVTLLYPFVSSLSGLTGHRPALTVDGAEVETTLHVGGYSGGFQGAISGLTPSEGTVNLRGFRSWEDYRDLLSDGSYQERALRDFPDLSAVPVTVYEFTNAWGPEDESGKAPDGMNPSVHAGFTLDYSKTSVLSYGFHGGCFDQEAGTMNLSFSVPESDWLLRDQPCYLFVVGEPVGDWKVYVSSEGAPDAQEDLEFGVEAGVDVRQYQSDLETALRLAAELMYGCTYDGPGEHPDFELYFGLMKDTLLSHGALSTDPKERYGSGSLEELDGDSVERVFYLEAAVTIPAGGSVTVEASFLKGPSMDFTCAHTKNEGICGYDMVTKLGTNLDITEQTAAALNTQYAEIVRQNFGFDWKNGVNAVTLDPDTEHYYLEVRQVKID